MEFYVVTVCNNQFEIMEQVICDDMQKVQEYLYQYFSKDKRYKQFEEELCEKFDNPQEFMDYFFDDEDKDDLRALTVFDSACFRIQKFEINK